MESEGILPGSSEPPPYTISDGRTPGSLNPSCPPSKSPLPNHRPFEAFGDSQNPQYGAYSPGQIGPQGQMPHGQMYPGQMPPGQLAQVHMGGPYGGQHTGYGYPPPGQPYPGPQYGASNQPPFYPPYAVPHHQRPQQQQQQQQSIVIVGGGSSHYNQPIVVVQSFAGQISLACFVFWCCGGFFGIAAFVLAVIASSQAHSDPVSARHLGRASLWVSVAGIIVCIVVICIIVGVVFSRTRSYYYY